MGLSVSVFEGLSGTAGSPGPREVRGWLTRSCSLPRRDQGRGSLRFSEGRVGRKANFFQLGGGFLVLI